VKTTDIRADVVIGDNENQDRGWESNAIGYVSVGSGGYAATPIPNQTAAC